MAIGDVKTYDITYSGLVLQINAIDIGGGEVRFEIKCLQGSADINALYFGDDVNDGSNYNLGGSLNMNGAGDWDSGVKLSSAGIGPAGVDKPTYLQAGESYVFDHLMSWATLDNLGVRATSTSTAEGSIKGVDGSADVTLAPTVCVEDAAPVIEGNEASFTIKLDHVYLYDVTINYTTVTGTAGSSDYTETTNSVTIAAGQLSTIVTVATTDDLDVEGTEKLHASPDRRKGGSSGNDEDFCVTLKCNDAVGTILDNDVVTPPVDTVIAVDDTEFACGVEVSVKVTGNVLANDKKIRPAHGLNITHVNGTALSALDATPDGNWYEFAITDGNLKINAETGAFEFTYSGDPLEVGEEWEGSFNYTVTDGDDTNDSLVSDHTATVDLCIDAAGGSPGYWAGNGNSPHDRPSNSRDLSAGLLDGTVTFDAILILMTARHVLGRAGLSKT